jgi:hypothetical protein
LIKGATYFVTAIWTYKNERTVNIKGVGSFAIKKFTLTNGKSLDKEPDFTINDDKQNLDHKKNYINHLIKCKYATGKYLKIGEIYFVENQKTNKTNGYIETKLKIRGINNWISTYRFEEIPIAEQRNIKLKNLKGNKIKTGEQTRKFLLYSEKEKINILFETLAKVLSDLTKIETCDNINLIELMLKKGKDYALIEKDITPFLGSKIETILEPLTTSNLH